MKIELVRGLVFVKSWSGRIVKVDWLGATMIYMGTLDDYGREGWFKRFLVRVDKDPMWFYRFNYGFSQGRVMQVYTTDCFSGQRFYHDDKTSKAGRDLAKRFGLC